MVLSRSPISKAVDEAGKYLNMARQATLKGDFLGGAAAYGVANKLIKVLDRYSGGLKGADAQGYRSVLSLQRQVGAPLARLGIRKSYDQLGPVATAYKNGLKIAGRPIISTSRTGMETEGKQMAADLDEYVKAVNPLVASGLNIAENTAKAASIIAADLSVRNVGDETFSQIEANAQKQLENVSDVRALLENRVTKRKTE